MQDAPRQIDGFCAKCPQGEKLKQWSQVQKWSLHVKYNQHKVEPIRHHCQLCDFKAQRQEDLEAHMCNEMQRNVEKAEFVQEYRLLPQRSKWMEDMRSKEPEDLAEIALEQRIIVPGVSG